MPAGMSIEDKLRTYTRVARSGCIEWRGKMFSNGYGCLYYRGKYMLAHRAAWEIAVGEIPIGMVVMHACDNRACVNVKRLSVGTHKDNMADAIAKGKLFGVRGEDNVRSILKLKDVKRIRALRRRGMLCRDIAALYPVSAKQISVVSRGVQWAHVGGAAVGDER